MKWKLKLTGFKLLVQLIPHHTWVEHRKDHHSSQSSNNQLIEKKERGGKRLNAIMGFIACVACITSICGLGGWQTAQEYWRRSTHIQTECVFDPCGPERANSTADMSTGRVPGEPALHVDQPVTLSLCCTMPALFTMVILVMVKYRWILRVAFRKMDLYVVVPSCFHPEMT